MILFYHPEPEPMNNKSGISWQQRAQRLHSSAKRQSSFCWQSSTGGDSVEKVWSPARTIHLPLERKNLVSPLERKNHKLALVTSPRRMFRRWNGWRTALLCDPPPQALGMAFGRRTTCF